MRTEQIEKTMAALRRNNMDAYFADTAEQAAPSGMPSAAEQEKPAAGGSEMFLDIDPEDDDFEE